MLKLPNYFQKLLVYTCGFRSSVYTAISIKVVPEQSGKVEYERERLAGNR